MHLPKSRLLSHSLPCSSLLEKGTGPAHPALELQGGYQNCPVRLRWTTTLGCGHGAAPWPWHLCLVQHLSLSFAGLGNLLIPGMDLGNDVTEVQASVVIHGQHHGHVAGLGLQLAQLLQRRLTQCPPAPQPPFPLELQGRWARGLTLCPHSFRGQPSFTLGGIEHS